MHSRHLLPFLIAPACLLTANVGAAESFDGSKALLCATVETVGSASAPRAPTGRP